MRTWIALLPLLVPAHWSDYVSKFETYVQDNGVVGASTVLVRDGQIVKRRDIGLADRELGQAVDGNTLFHYGSITKTLTADEWARSAGAPVAQASHHR